MGLTARHAEPNEHDEWVPKIEKITVADIVDSPDQPKERTSDVRGLAESMKVIGQMAPIMVRNIKGKFELISGHRRTAAARLLKWTAIDAIVVPADSDRAQVMAIADNVQRLPMTAWQECEAITKLQALGRKTEEIAAELGMTPQYIARRSKLANISPKLLKAARDRKHPVSGWSTAMFELMARYPIEIQDRFIERGWIPDTIDRLRQRLAEMDDSISAAPWKLDDEALLPEAGACSNCPKRASQQPLLFDREEITIKGAKGEINDRCMDRTCWDRKLAAYAKGKTEQILAEHAVKPLIVRTDYGYSGHDDTQYRAIYGCTPLDPDDYRCCSKDTKGAQPAIQVDGKAAGKTLWVLTGAALSSSNRAGNKAAKKKEPGKPPTEKERQDRLKGRRALWIVKEIDSRIEKMKAPQLPEGLVVLPSDDIRLMALLRFIAAFGFDPFHGNYNVTGGGWSRRYSVSSKATKPDLVKHLWGDVKRTLHRQFLQMGSMAEATTELPHAWPAIELILGISQKEMEKVALVVIPDRKAKSTAPAAPKKSAKAAGKTKKAKRVKGRGWGASAGK